MFDIFIVNLTLNSNIDNIIIKKKKNMLKSHPLLVLMAFSSNNIIPLTTV